MKAANEGAAGLAEAHSNPLLINAVVAANDNAWPTALSREVLETGSLLSQIDVIEPRQSFPMGLILIGVLCILASSPLLLLGL